MEPDVQIIVYLLAFGEAVPIPERPVDLPEDVTVGMTPSRLYEEQKQTLLDSVFYYGQNDFQPKPIRSVSVGDVIKLPDGSLHRVLGAGFEALPAGTDVTTLERGRACSLL